MSRNKLTASILIAILGLSACSEQKTAEQHLTLSQQLLEQDKVGEAIVELKNAIKNNLSNPKLRLALAESYLLQGNFLSAEKEFDKSLSLGVPVSEVINGLSFAKSKLGKAEDVFQLVEQGSELSDDKYVELLLNAGVAALNNSQAERGQDYLSQAISISNGENIAGLLAKGYLEYSIGNFSGGLDYANQILNENDLEPEALLLRGHLLFASKEYHMASESFEKYQKIVPSDLNVRLFEINSLIQSEQITKAEKRLELIYEGFKSNFAINQYKSQIEYYKKSYAEAKIYADKALSINSAALMARVISGMSAFKLQNYEQAYTGLNPIIKRIPSDNSIHQVYAFLKLQLGYSSDIENVSGESPTIEMINNDLFLSKGIGLIEQGSQTDVEDLIQQRNSSIDSSLERAELGALKVIAGNESGIIDLEDAVKAEPTSDRLKVALVAAYLANNRVDEALIVASDWQTNNPQNLNANLLVAKVYLQIKKPERAIEYLNNTLAVDPDNTFALMFFAEKAIAEKRFLDAKGMANQILSVHPNYTAAFGVLYKATRDNPAETISKIETLVKGPSANLNDVILFASILYHEKRYEEVIEVLKDRKTITSNSLNEYWILLGESYSKLGKYDEALAITEAWISVKPKLPIAWYAKLNTLETQGNKPALLSTTEKVLKEFPNDTRFRMLMPHYLVINGDYRKAEQAISRLLPEEQATDFVKGLQGQILFAKKDYKSAIPLLETQYDIKPSPQNSGLLYTALIKSNKLENALAFMDGHLKKNPNDKLTKFFYAQYLMGVNAEKSKEVYSQLLIDDPKNVVVLNNLASLEFNNKNFSRAEELASQALSLSKDSPEIMDTLAMIKLSQGNKSEALSLLDRALKLAPDNDEIKKHIALANAKK